MQTLALPVREPDITVGPVVLTDQRMLAVADSHPLATRDSVNLEDLADCVVPHVIPDLLLAVVVADQAVCVVFGEADRYYRRPGVTYLPIRDAPPTRWALLWRTAAETPLIRAFARAAKEAAGAAGAPAG